MMHGGRKSIGARHATASDHELEDYFAGLDDGNFESLVRTPADADPFTERTDIWSAQRLELRRLTAYAAHLKHEISTFSQTLDRSDQAVGIDRSRFPIIRSVAAAAIITVAGLVTYRLLERR